MKILKKFPLLFLISMLMVFSLAAVPASADDDDDDDRYEWRDDDDDRWDDDDDDDRWDDDDDDDDDDDRWDDDDRDPRPTSVKGLVSKKTVTVGKDFDLKVRFSPSYAEEDYLVWSIVSGSSVVRFDDDDRTGDEVELKARRAGSARVRCQIRGTNVKTDFVITVRSNSVSSIRAISSRSRTVTAGSDFDLKVRMTPSYADENKLSWRIVKGSSYVRFDDDDRYDDEMEFTARRAGKAVIRCQIRGTNKYVDFNVTVKAPSYKISRVGSSTKYVRAGRDFELKVKKSDGLSDRYLRWTIANRSIVAFDDDDRTGDDVEFRARRKGTTKVTCKNTKTGKSITYTIRVR